MIIDDRPLTINEVANLISLSHGELQIFCAMNLGWRRFLSTQWMPRLMTPDQMRTKVITSRENLTYFEADRTGNFEHFLSQDGCLVHHFQPDKERQSMQGKSHFSPIAKKSKGCFISKECDGWWDANTWCLFTALKKDTLPTEYSAMPIC